MVMSITTCAMHCMQGEEKENLVRSANIQKTSPCRTLDVRLQFIFNSEFLWISPLKWVSSNSNNLEKLQQTYLFINVLFFSLVLQKNTKSVRQHFLGDISYITYGKS